MTVQGTNAPLTSAWLDAGGQVDPSAPLEEALRDALHAARAGWEGVEVEDASFVAHLARLCGPSGSAALEALRLGDVYLAFACSEGGRRALAAFDRAFAGEVRGAAARAPGGEGADDLRQRVWQRIFVPQPGHPPRILQYRGRSPLGAWVRAVAARTALNQAPRPEAQPAEDERLLSLPSSSDPELSVIRDRYARQFRAAFMNSFGALEPAERNLLRQYYLDGLTFEQLATLLGVHTATAFRRLERVRQKLLDQTRDRLTRELRVRGRELDSLMRVLDDGFELSRDALRRTGKR